MDVEEHHLRGDAPSETKSPISSVQGLAVETVVSIQTEDKPCCAEENVATCVTSSEPEENPSDSSVGVLANDVVSDDAKVGESRLKKAIVEETKSKSCEEVERRSSSCVIDVKWDGESVCRICHLSSDQSPDRTPTTSTTTAAATATSVADLIQLGCGCKDDLGITHYQCAEAWFKLKGNRVCEICGETAKNVTGVGDTRFMEEWNERLGHSPSGSSERPRGCWRGQPFCNFLMACLVIAFVLPWFFRVNMF